MAGERVWDRHLRFQTDRPPLALTQSPQTLVNLLHGEVLEARDAYNKYRTVVEHNGDLYEFLFELADIYIFTMALAQQLGRNDLAPQILGHLQSDTGVVHTYVDEIKLPEKMSLLENQSLRLRKYVEETPDHEMGPHDEIFTHSLLGIAAVAGSAARDISPDPRISFGHIVEAKIRYNEYRYKSHFFEFEDEPATRFHRGRRIPDAFEKGRLQGKEIQRQTPHGEMIFLSQVLREANITLSTASGPTYLPESHWEQ